MRILFVAPYLPYPPDHGGRLRSHAMLRFLASEHEVHLLAPMGGGDETVRVEALRALARTAEALPSGPSRSAARKVTHWARGRSELAARRWSRRAVERVAAALREPWDLVFVDSTWALPALPSAVPAPTVLHLHNVESAILARPGERTRSVSARVSRATEARLLAGLERRAARAARLVLVVSDEDRERLLRLSPGAAVEVVPNSVDLDRLPFLPPSASRPPLLLFVGSFDYPPNREAARVLLRELLPVLRARHRDLRVRLVGHDPDGEITALARAAEAEATGFVPDLVPHYREATAVCAPIRTGGGSRLKILEAFAVGRPVLTTRIGAEGLPVREGEHYLEFGSAGEAADALDRLLRGEAAAIAASARRLVEARFSHRVVGDRLRTLLRERFRAGLATGTDR